MISTSSISTKAKKITAPLANEEIHDSNDKYTTKRVAIRLSTGAAVSDNTTENAEALLPSPLENESEETSEVDAEENEPTVTLAPLPVHEEEEGGVEEGPAVEEATLEANQLAAGDTEEIAESEQIEEVISEQDEATVHETTLETEPVLLDDEETITECLNDSDGEHRERGSVSSDAQGAIAAAVRIIDNVKEEERAGLPALNGHVEERARLPARLNTALVPAYVRRNDTYSRKIALQKRMVRKRWLRDGRTHQIRAFNTTYQLCRNRRNFSLYPGACGRGGRRLWRL